MTGTHTPPAQPDPGAGAKVPRGTPIAVYTSNGEGAIVPDVVSDVQDYNDARDELHDAGFNNTDEVCEVAPPGDPLLQKVVAQNPAAGSLLNRNAEIALTVRKLVCTP